MEFRRIGSLEVSAVGLGCNNFGWRIAERASAEVVNAALDAGINFFDTADVYGAGHSEEYLGRALRGRRERAVIATKFGMRVDRQRQGGARPEYIRQSVEGSLRRLGTDAIDLYQLHRPDPSTPIEETMETLDGLVRAGKVREIGCSNFSVPQLRQAAAAARPGAARFVSIQNEYSVLRRDDQRAVLEECARTGMAFIPYFPLASGLLTGKYRHDEPPPPGSRGRAGWGPKYLTPANLDAAEALRQFAAQHGRSLLELAIGWLLSQSAVASVIAGATSPEQARQNAAGAGWRLTPQEFEDVDRLVTPVGAFQGI